LSDIAKKIFDKKISLIYEYNKNSSLFVRMANAELENNNVDNAVKILQNGLRIFPDYPVAYILLGKTYALMGGYDKAEEYFKRGSEILGSSETYRHYLNEISVLKKRRSLFKSTSGRTIPRSPKVPIKSEDENSLFHQEKKTSSVEKLTSSIDEKLDQLAKELSQAKISANNQPDIKQKDFLNQITNDNMLVSETLAKIYLAQNEYNEAIKVYEKLLKKDYDKYDYYTGKIREIRTKIDS
jgi:tetratricopeptide (TPR) repeat protein